MSLPPESACPSASPFHLRHSYSFIDVVESILHCRRAHRLVNFGVEYDPLQVTLGDLPQMHMTFTGFMDRMGELFNLVHSYALVSVRAQFIYCA